MSKYSKFLFVVVMCCKPVFSQSASDNMQLTDRQLLDRIAIEALATEYYYLLDHGQAEKLADLFTEDGVQYFAFSNQKLAGKAEIHKYYQARSKTRITRHVSTNLRLVFESDDRVSGIRTISYYAGEGEDIPVAIPSIAEYEEVFVRGDDGQLRFALRKVKGVFRRLDE